MDNSPQQSDPQANRDVDVAMAADRPAKQSVRQLWLQQAQHFNELYPEDDVPLYLTLSGAEARDIRLLAEHQIIKLTEVGGIAEESKNRVVAVESDQQAFLQLKLAFPGLRVIGENFKGVVQGDTLTRFPTKEVEKICCAKIVNLDLTQPLLPTKNSEVFDFPVIRWVEKLSLLHTEIKPRANWCLCLTLNGTIGRLQPETSEQIGKVIKDFLKENFERSIDFEKSCKSLLGDDLHQRICSEELLEIDNLGQEDQQRLLMVFVPKKIAQRVHNHNWQVDTLWNLHYGGHSGHAPMVTWVLSFIWDERAQSMPDAVYKDSLNKILASAGYIEDDGKVQTIKIH